MICGSDTPVTIGSPTLKSWGSEIETKVAGPGFPWVWSMYCGSLTDTITGLVICTWVWTSFDL